MQRDIQPPNPPTNLLGEPISQNIINLQWSDNSNNEGGFKVYRNDAIIATIGPNSRIYQDPGLEAGQIYRYTVRAYNEAGESGASYCTVKTLNPPLNVTIDYVGVIFDHDPIGPGDIKLFLYVGGNRVDAAVKGDTVTARLSLFGGNPGQYKMLIRRDIELAPDQTVVEDSFYYDGSAATMELSFVPPYATSESSTDGYHIDLLREGSSAWSMTDAYPPRLRVTLP